MRRSTVYARQLRDVLPLGWIESILTHPSHRSRLVILHHTMTRMSVIFLSQQFTSQRMMASESETRRACHLPEKSPSLPQQTSLRSLILDLLDSFRFQRSAPTVNRSPQLLNPKTLSAPSNSLQICRNTFRCTRHDRLTQKYDTMFALREVDEVVKLLPSLPSGLLRLKGAVNLSLHSPLAHRCRPRR